MGTKSGENSVDFLLDKLKNSLPGICGHGALIRSSGPHRPTAIVLDQTYGVVAVEVGDPHETASDVRSRMNDKISRIEQEIPSFPAKQIVRISIVNAEIAHCQSINRQTVVISRDMLESADWADGLQFVPVELDLLETLGESLRPRLFIELPRVEEIEDNDRDERQSKRVLLDDRQQRIAARELTGILLVTGGPGTGKTLVLLGRAIWLSSEHPDWKVVLVVYNNLLMRYLRSYPGIPNGVEVMTLKRFLEVRGQPQLARLLLRFDDPEQAEEEARQIVANITLKEGDVDIDALLIDEFQDFRQPYLDFVLKCLRPNRGGAVLAGDTRQAIYADEVVPKFDEHEIEVANLETPYRSTQQILRVVSSLDEKFHVDGIHHAPMGAPVTVIQASSWPDQAAAISIEIKKLIDVGERRPGEIAVLCTTRGGANHVQESLRKAAVPHRVLTRFWEDPSPGGDEVNVSTIHGAKGQGHNVVFVQGLETLKDADGTPQADKWRRVGFVAMTRAQDLLYLVYKTPTQLSNSALSLSGTGLVVSRVYPDDY